MVTKQEVEDKLIDFFDRIMDTRPEDGIVYVRRFAGYLCTNDNGVVIDCEDGSQIRLIIQIC